MGVLEPLQAAQPIDGQAQELVRALRTEGDDRCESTAAAGTFPGRLTSDR